MKHNILGLIFVLVTAGLHAGFYIPDEDYIVKTGDEFAIHIVTADTLQLECPVMMAGDVSLYPIASTIRVAGMNLKDAKEAILTALRKRLTRSEINVVLSEYSPFVIHMTGAVISPGEYLFEDFVSLDNAIRKTGGFLPTASRRVQVTRQGVTKTFDLKKYYSEGDVSQNPILMHDDRIQVTYAKNFARVYVNTDTLNIFEFFEIDGEIAIPDLMHRIDIKHPRSELDDVRIFRNGKILSDVTTSKVVPGDSVFVSIEEVFVYVTGFVMTPGRYTYNGRSTVEYYVNRAGGVDSFGTYDNIVIIDGQGRRHESKNYKLRPGDTVYVPEHWWSKMRNHLSSVSVIASIISTIVIISVNLK